MLGTFFTHSVAGATLLIACTGVSWGVTQWAPFSLLAEAILTAPAPAEAGSTSIRLADTHAHALLGNARAQLSVVDVRTPVSVSAPRFGGAASSSGLGFGGDLLGAAERGEGAYADGDGEWPSGAGAGVENEVEVDGDVDDADWDGGGGKGEVGGGLSAKAGVILVSLSSLHPYLTSRPRDAQPTPIRRASTTSSSSSPSSSLRGSPRLSLR
ncbi:hypothetical protein B0H11DRAFT_46081 [Mycena galericulata]|nr:hypothetical protein B0H11DRAFT_46081 [Mycena galericulata]